MYLLKIVALFAALAFAAPTIPTRPVGCGPALAHADGGGARSIGSAEGHVWLVDLNDPSLGIPNALSAAEQARMAQLRVPRAQLEFARARGALRAILASYLGVPAEAIALGIGTSGKPFIESPKTDLTFNISHSAGKLAVVVTRGRSVGVDIERHNLARDWSALGSRIFHPNEARYLRSQPPERAYRIWTLKEAVLKALGTGIDRDLTTFSVVDEKGTARFSGNVPQDFTAHFSEPLTDRFAGFELAIVSHGREPLGLRFYEWR